MRMESETLDVDADVDVDFDVDVSWSVVDGSVGDVVSCESSISNCDSQSNHNPAPLILRRPEPDSAPCQITICFTQQHEVKQVYVRSTARVYEIYYSTNINKAADEYLCTVRCGVAAMNDTSLSTAPNTDSDSSQPNEDDWVHLNLQNPSCLSNKHVTQDLFEATAQISDADPLLSITIRLLSIQTGDYVCIQEVYVFADPVLPISPTSTPQTSSQTATMSLLIPTLFNLSNFPRNQMQQHTHSVVEERNHQDTGFKSTNAAAPSTTSHSQSIEGTVLNDARMSQQHFPIQTSDPQNNPYSTCERNTSSSSRIERTLDELVSRLAKIEDFCLRFEEKMVKPITNMEARLERVEQQLESFAKTTAPMTACTRMSAPEFSCIESESNSILVGGNDSSGIIYSESIKKEDSRFQELSIPPSDAYSSLSSQPNNVSSPITDAVHITPSLVVTAPDFSYVDDEGEIDSFEGARDLAKGSPKKPLSINDALASALAGFLSSVSNNDTDMAQDTTDVSSEEENGSPCLSKLTLPDECVNSSVYIDGSQISCQNEYAVAEHKSFGAGNGFDETTESIDEHKVLLKEAESEKSLGNSVYDVVNLDQVKADINDESYDGSREVNDDSIQTSVFGSSDTPGTDISVAALEVPSANIDSGSGEEMEKECPGILLNFFKLQSPAVVDFGIPILDVKFSPQENFYARSSLDALLVDATDACSEVPCVDEYNTSSSSEQYDLVLIGNMDSTISETPNNQSFCLDNYDTGNMPSDREEGEMQECSIHDMDASLI